jgi:hypothetical protein
MDGVLLFPLTQSTHMQPCNQEQHKLKYDTKDVIMQSVACTKCGGSNAGIVTLFLKATGHPPMPSQYLLRQQVL